MEPVSYLDQFIFGVYPYICITVFLFGSLVRFDREQYTWKADSSELLHRGQLRLGSVLFHLGIIGVFFGHVAGLLTPLELFHLLGVTPETKQLLAIVMGGSTATLALIGLLILIHRRMRLPRINANSSWRDKLVLFWLFITVSVGYSLVFLAFDHLDGEEMIKMMSYVQNLVTFDAHDAVQFVSEVSPVMQLHVFLGFTFFLIFPFTRMVHVWSGFAIFVSYIPRAWQLVRRR